MKATRRHSNGRVISRRRPFFIKRRARSHASSTTVQPFFQRTPEQSTIQPYRDKTYKHEGKTYETMNYGLANTGALIEEPWGGDKTKQPWIEQIDITLPTKTKDKDNFDFWQGNLAATYHANDKAKANINMPISGGGISLGKSDPGSFKVRRIEGQGYNSGKYSDKFEHDPKDPRRRYSKNPDVGNMHLAVFYNGGEAIHMGALDDASHGCIHAGNDGTAWQLMTRINYHSVIGLTKVNVSY